MAQLALNRLSALDGLRGIAALGVVCAHYKPARLPAGFEGPQLFAAMYEFSLANLAVAFFFGLSAFLLAWKAEHAFSAREFVVRRVLRIVPLYVFVLLTTLLLFWLTGHRPQEMANTLRHLWLYLSFLYNWTHAFDRWDYVFELNQLWSLCIEMQFYALFAASFVFFRKKPVWLIAVILAGIAIRFAFALVPHSMLYFNSFAYVEIFVLCALLGVLHARGWKAPSLPWSAILLLLLVVGLAWKPVLWTVTPAAVLMYSVVAVAVAATLWTATHDEGPLTRWLGSRVMQWLGAISYGLYMWHLPVHFAMHKVDTGNVIANFALYLAACLSVSWLSYRFIETRYTRYRSRIAQQPSLRRRLH